MDLLAQLGFLSLWCCCVCVQISVAKRSFVAFPSEHKGHLGQIYIRATVVHLDT